MEKKPPSFRGTSENFAGRFEPYSLEGGDFVQVSYDDQGQEEIRPLPRTQFFVDHSRTVLSENDSPDIPFRFGLNPYRGCEHGCVYCYARPTHEYLGLSPGLDFESKIFVKPEAPALLREALLRKSWKPQTINVSGVTDCYQPIERKLEITRRCVEVLGQFRNPFGIITKNHLVTRDIDLLKPMAELGATAVFVSITSLDDRLIERMEPRTSRPSFRLKALEKLNKAGIPVGVMVAPVLPGLTDHEMPAILKSASDAGARWAGYTLLRLPYRNRELMTQWLETHFPDRKEKILSRLRDLHDGKLYDSTSHHRMRGEGPFAESMKQIFQLYSRKHGLNREKLELSTAHFRRVENPDQMELL